jgi:hypothetical protein
MHRRASIFGLCFIFTAALAPLLSQTHHVDAPERVTRAVGVFEWTGDISKPTAARLVPVSIFINNNLEDAGVYLSRPIPLALDTGNIYAVERAGLPIGTLDVDAATRVASSFSADANPITAWYGLGRFTPPPSPAEVAAKEAKLKASAKVGTILGGSAAPADDDTPHFVFRKPSDTAPTSTTTASSKPASTDDTADPDRPTLRHRDASVDPDKKQKKQKAAGYVTGTPDLLSDDPDRPTLERGDASSSTLTPELRGLPANMQQAVAVSDANHTEDHPFAREWDSSTERLTILSTLQDLARPRITNYLIRNHLIPAAATPRPVTPITAATPVAAAPPEYTDDTSSHPTLVRTPNGVDTSTTKSAPTPKASPSEIPKKPHTSNTQKYGSKTVKTALNPSQFVFTHEQLSSYSLTYGGLPTFIYTTQVPVTEGGPVYLTLVAQRIPSGEVQVSLSSITDATHLNRTPWLRPIDVVDPDDSHRASLLFELRAQRSRQFGLYRLVTAQAEQTFLTGIIE